MSQPAVDAAPSVDTERQNGAHPQFPGTGREQIEVDYRIFRRRHHGKTETADRQHHNQREQCVLAEFAKQQEEQREEDIKLFFQCQRPGMEQRFEFIGGSEIAAFAQEKNI
ncbi:MAG: hypothetical protein N2C12_13055 [Planctomycetales bacterium]